jgi:RNA polymerase sigma-70 factor (ECF subfamily)
MAYSAVEERFNEIYDSTYKSVMAYIASKCGNAADIGDIAQETYLEVYGILCKRGAGYAWGAKTLVMKIARQKLSQHYSRLERLKMLVPLYNKGEDGEETLLPELEAEAEVFRTEDYVIDQMMLDSIRQIIKQKPEDIKKVLYMFYELGMTLAEIAKELSMSESNVKHKLYRTLKEVRDRLH